MTLAGIVIQARMGSTRLPGKVLADLGGRPMLVRQIERLRLVPGIDRVIVATSDTAIDDPVAALVRTLDGVELWRGSEDDVLARFAGAAAAFDLDVIGRVTGDCPLIDPVVIGKVLSAFNATADCDYASNCRPRTWPSGFDVEFVSRRALDAAAAEAIDPFDRQHVLVYVFTQPERFRCVNVENDGPGLPQLRLTVDYREDLELVRALFTALRPVWPNFGLTEMMKVLKDRPDLLRINADVPAHESITDASQRGMTRSWANN